MRTLASTAALLAIGSLGTAVLQAAPPSEPVAVSVTTLPTVRGPIPVSRTSWPFAATDHSVTKRDLSKEGYVEEEYFISGMAKVYEWPALGRLMSFAQGPYTTRILVRRPKEASRFSGTVIVEPLNPSLRYDAAIMWIESQDYFIRHGDAYVGVTVKPVAVESLKLFDPQRYAALSFKNPLPVSQTCAQPQLPPAPGGLPPESTPETENGLIWDVISQTGALLGSRSNASPLSKLAVTRIYLTGDSQSGGFVLNYANAIHPFATRADGKPIYDGYLTSSAGGAGLPINQCAPRIPRGDARLVTQPRGVPIIKIINQTDLGFLNRRPDIAPDLYRGYEVTGASHVHDWVLQWGAADEDVAKTGAAGFLSNAGVPPPRARPLEVRDPLRARATLALDELGNAKGGVRTPYVDVPLVRYGVFMDGPGICELWGYQVPLAAQTLRQLYPSRAVYLARVEEATERTLEERWITRHDADRILSEASAAALP